MKDADHPAPQRRLQAGGLMRRLAEDLLHEQASAPANGKPPSPEEALEALRELQLHQIELEMQNEELRRVQAELVSQGFTSRRIGVLLFISPRTVDSHRQAIMRKLGLPNGPALVKFALEHGFAIPPPLFRNSTDVPNSGSTET